MKNIFNFTTIIALLLSSVLSSQKKYPSLLWEISGNGLKEKSYLYGTMHVSEKIAFNLSDIFFEKLHAVKQVALESDPALWMDSLKEEMEDYPTDYNYYSNDYNTYKYTSLYLNPIAPENYKEALQANYFIADGILYRRYTGMQNFRENTYLDMFIYRSAKKLNKKFHGLEDSKESRRFIEKANQYAFHDDYYYSKRKSWLKKLIKDQPIQTVMENAYRKQDLDLIDSLHKGSYPDRILKYVLYERNDVMVKAIDSLMKKGSLFSAVGAAHLAGKKGIIEKLKNKGYTVKPLIGAYTEKGKKQKDNIDDLLYNHPLNTTVHNEFSIKAPNKFFAFPNKQSCYLISMDIPNGAFLSISKFSHFDFLDKNSYRFSLQSIDSLLYENIPGKILSKKRITNNGYSGIEVMSKNDNDERLNTQIFLTPLEVYIFNLYGTENYENQYKNTVFSSLKLKSYTNTFSDFTPKSGGYTVNLPDYRIDSDTLNQSLNVTAYDKNSNSYYFINSEIMDVISPEEEPYELVRIPHEFAKNLNSNSLEPILVNDDIPYSETRIPLNDNKFLYLKTIINGAHYNLIGIVTADEAIKNRYFNSFRLTDFTLHKKTEKYENKKAGYSIPLPIRPKQDKESSLVEDSVAIDKVDYYENTSLYKLENGQELTISYYNDYWETDSLNTEDIIKEFVSHQFTPDSCTAEKLRFVKSGISANKYPFSDYILENESSAQAYKLRYFSQNNRIYELKYIINRHREFNIPSTEEIFSDILFFDPEKKEDSNDAESIDKKNAETGRLYDKITVADSTADDSPVFQESYTQIEDDGNLPNDDDYESYTISNDSLLWIADNKKNQPMLNKIKALSTDYKKVENFMLSSSPDSLNPEILEIVMQVLNHHDKTQSDFYEKLYPKFKNNGNVEFDILNQIVSMKDNKKSLKTVLKLLKSTSPIPSSESPVYSLLYSFRNIENSENTVVPALLSFLSVNEYKAPIMYYLQELNSEDKLKSNHIKKHRKYFLNEAENDLKRFLNNENNNVSEYYYSAEYYPYNILMNLKDYLDILSVVNDSDYKRLISKIRNTKDIYLLKVLAELKNPVELTQNEYLSLIKEIILSKKITDEYTKKFGQDIFNPEKDLTAYIAKKFLMKNINDKYHYISSLRRDSLFFKEERTLVFNTKKYKVYYFTIKKDNTYYDHSLYSEGEKEDEKEPEYNGTDVGIIAFDLTPNEKCSDNYDYEYEHYLSDESTVRIAFLSTNINYYDEDDWNELDRNFIDYLENKNHPRATTLFNEDYYLSH
ncbi:MAG: TraB/GumN family protein [Flavobacteriaceae bacterium]|jgi:uncharacterized protein YbaP (TraB family)|nr:TraB/GumN family protein [Flavobacteriaceae bacterium]